MRGLVVIAVGSAACAATTSVCPVGTKRIDLQQPQGRAQLCATTEPLATAMPMPGRSFEATLGVAQPAGLSGGVQGPFTSWYPNGAIASHGHYLDFGARSVPDGLWAFWYANGARRTMGTYHRGEPTGCFAVWDEAGARSTGYVEGDQLRVAPCTPPPDDELLIAEGRAPGAAAEPVRGDVSVQGFFGPGTIGARNSLQLDPDPGLRLGLGVAARMRLGPWRVGPTATLRLSDNTDYMGLGAGAVAGHALPRLHPRIDSEVAIELAAQHVSATAMRPQHYGTAELAFWSPLAAVQLAVAFALSPYLEAVAAARVDGAPMRTVDRDVSYCGAGGCLPPEQETWRVGGLSYGLNLGLRLVIR